MLSEAYIKQPHLFGKPICGLHCVTGDHFYPVMGQRGPMKVAVRDAACNFQFLDALEMKDHQAYPC